MQRRERMQHKTGSEMRLGSNCPLEPSKERDEEVAFGVTDDSLAVYRASQCLHAKLPASLPDRSLARRGARRLASLVRFV